MCVNSRRSSKYPRRYSACNDTFTACGLLCCCCGSCEEYATDDVLLHTKEDTDAESAMIWEKTVDKTVKTINGNWSWASAGLLATAFQATLSLGDNAASAVAGNWIYFAGIFAIGVLLAVFEHSFESPETIAEELKLKVPTKKAALGDKKALKTQKALLKKATTMTVSNE